MMAETLIILIIQCLLCSGGIFLACKALRWMLPRLSRRLLPIFLSLFLLIGSYAFSKSDGLGAMLRSSARALTEAVARGGAALISVHTGGSIDFSPTETAITNEPWATHGAHSDVITLTPDANRPWFMKLGSNRVSRIGVTSRGTVHPLDPKHGLSMCNGYEFSILDASLGIAPRAHWSLLENPSVFWHDITSNNSLRLTWSSVLLERDTHSPISFQVEFYQSGDFTYRYNFVENIPSNYIIGYNFQGYAQTWTNHTHASTIELCWRAFNPPPKNSIDADHDGISDYDEIYVYGTDPNNPDTDGDGLRDDIDENPILCDANYDGVPDGFDEAEWRQNPLFAENAGYTNCVLFVQQGMPTPDASMPRRARASTPTSEPFSALLNLHGCLIPLYTGSSISLAIPRREFLTYQTVLRGNRAIQLRLLTDEALYLEGETAAFSEGAAIDESGRLALPTLSLYPLSPNGSTCLHGHDTGVAFRPILHPMTWAESIPYGELFGFSLQFDHTLWLDAPETNPGAVTGTLTFSAPWLFSGRLSASASIHWCMGHGTYCYACNTVHTEYNACSHVPECLAKQGLEYDCTCPPIFLRVNSDDDNADNTEDRYNSSDKGFDNDIVSFSTSGINTCCCALHGYSVSPVRITNVSSDLRLMDSFGNLVSLGTSIETEHFLVEGMVPTRDIGAGSISYTIYRDDGSPFRTLSRAFTASNVQLLPDITDNHVINGQDHRLRNEGIGRTTPWKIVKSNAPYLFLFQNESPITNCTLSLSYASSDPEAPLLKIATRNDTLAPGQSTNAPPFCFKNTTTAFLLDTSAITNTTTLNLTAKQEFTHTHSPVTDTLNIQIFNPDIPDITVRTNHLCDVVYDYSHIPTSIYWKLRDRDSHASIFEHSGRIFTPPQNLEYGYYEVEAQFMELWENGNNIVKRTGKLDVVPVVLEPILTTPDKDPHWNPIYVPLNKYGTFHIEVGDARYIPNQDIQWECNGVTFSNNVNYGRTVYVQPSTTDSYTLKIHIKNFIGPTPQITFNGVVESTIPVHVWIVCDDNSCSATPSIVTNHLDGVNRIFSQVGTQFELYSISNLFNNSWMEFDVDHMNKNERRRLDEMFTNSFNTNRLNVYYIDSVLGNAIAFSDPKGIVVTSSNSFETVGHEIGHWFGLVDIYRTNEETHERLDDSLIFDHCPLDWSCATDEGYYTDGLRLCDLISRLLMFGYASETSSDIPMGFVWGAWYRTYWNSEEYCYEKIWIESLLHVGFGSIRNPQQGNE